MRWKKQYNNQNDILTKQLLLSCANGDLEAVQDCLQQSSSLHGGIHDLIHCTEPELGWTPLHVACYRRNADIVELLLNEGANPNICASDGYAPLRLFVVIGSINNRASSSNNNQESENHLEEDREEEEEEEEHNCCRIIEALLQHGADPCGCVDARSVSSPLHVAAQNGKLHMVELLIEYGAFFHVQKTTDTKKNNSRGNTTSNTNSTPKRLFMSQLPACATKHRIPKRLSMSTVTVSSDSTCNNITENAADTFPAAAAVHRDDDDDSSSNETDSDDDAVVETSTPREEEDTTTLTPLAIACRQGHGHVVDYLLHNVMPPTIVLGDAELMIPFQEACYNYHVDCIVRLLRYGLEILYESQHQHDGDDGDTIDVETVVESLIKIALDPADEQVQRQQWREREGEEGQDGEEKNKDQDDPELKRLKKEAFRLELFREACRAHMVDVIVPLLPYVDTQMIEQEDDKEKALAEQKQNNGAAQHIHEDDAHTHTTSDMDDEEDADEASSAKQPRSLKSILITAVDPNKNQTVLHRVCAKKNTEWVKKILQFAREQGNDAVDESEEKDDGDDEEDCITTSQKLTTNCVLDRLVNAVDVDLKTALHLACKADFLEGVQSLLECPHISTNVEDINGDTPLMLTQGEDVARCILRLQKHPARLFDLINRPNCQTGQTRLHTASCEGNFNLCHALLQFGADPNLGDLQGCTALYLSSARGFAQICTSLLAQGADPNVTTANLAADGVHGALAIGPQPDAVVGGDTPLHAACRGGHLNVILRLYGADVQAVNARGRTPLHEACERGHVEVVEYLLTERRARLDVTDLPEGDFTPFELACHAKRYNVMYYLIHYFAEHGRKGIMRLDSSTKQGSHATDLNPVALIQPERSFGRSFGVVPNYDSVDGWDEKSFLYNHGGSSQNAHEGGLGKFLEDAASWGAEEGISCGRTVSSCTTIGDHTADHSKLMETELSWDFWKNYYKETS